MLAFCFFFTKTHRICCCQHKRGLGESKFLQVLHKKD